MNDNELMELVKKSGNAVLDILEGKTITGDEMSTFWATLIGNISEMIYKSNPEAYPWAACMLTGSKLGVVANRLRKEHENGRKTKGKKL